jgi:hypothetical protein
MSSLQLFRISFRIVVLGVVLWVTGLIHPVHAQMTGGEAGRFIDQETAGKSEINMQLETLQREVERAGHSFTVGYNPAMEIPLDRLCGLKEPENWQQHAPFMEMESGTAQLPSSFDWREFGIVPPVRNQGSCGSCWAFATVAPLESQILYQCGVAEDLSEQYLVSCNRSQWGCSGGSWAHDYHQLKLGKDLTDPGAVREQQFPYRSRKVVCGGPHAHPYKIDSWAYIQGPTVPSIQQLKQAIFDRGPVAAGVCVDDQFRAYTGGIFDYNGCGISNHGIALVGWHDDGGPDEGYWILRNSWGPDWGEDGYMRIRYGTSRVGKAANYIVFTKCIDRSGGLCADPVDLTSPVNGDTTSGVNQVRHYGDIPWDESGPEGVYRLTTGNYRDIGVFLDSGTTDLDVFILTSCGPGSTVAYGDEFATLANAPPGTYLIVVDGRDGAAGPYMLSVVETCPLPPAPGSISGPVNDADGSFRVTWAWAKGAMDYTLQRADSPTFENVATIYTGTLNYYDESGLNNGEYFYRVRTNNDCGNSSDWQITGPVLVGPPAITVNYPNGGELWKIGARHIIRWSYTTQKGSSVKIELFKGGRFIRLIGYAQGSDGAGAKGWSVPSTMAPGNNCQIRVTSTVFDGYRDTSDEYFSIVD